MHSNTYSVTERRGGLPDRLRAMAADEIEGRRPVLSPANSHDLLAAADEIERLRLTDEERGAIQWVVGDALSVDGVSIQETLRGLLERHFPTPEKGDIHDNTPPTHSNQSDGSVRHECAAPWLAWPFYVDPSGVWRYGFPKLYDPAADGDITAWMVANGYPQHLADEGLPCTFTSCTDSQ